MDHQETASNTGTLTDGQDVKLKRRKDDMPSRIDMAGKIMNGSSGERGEEVEEEGDSCLLMPDGNKVTSLCLTSSESPFPEVSLPIFADINKGQRKSTVRFTTDTVDRINDVRDENMSGKSDLQNRLSMTSLSSYLAEDFVNSETATEASYLLENFGDAMQSGTAILLMGVQNEFTAKGGKLHDDVKTVMEGNGMLSKIPRVIETARYVKLHLETLTYCWSLILNGFETAEKAAQL